MATIIHDSVAGLRESAADAPPRPSAASSNALPQPLPMLLTGQQAAKLLGLSYAVFSHPFRRVRWEAAKVKVQGLGRKPMIRYRRDKFIEIVNRAAAKGEL